MHKVKSSKKSWSYAEDAQLLHIIEQAGPHSWEKIGSAFPRRSGKQCRERWLNQLNPLLKQTAWTIEEEWVLCIMHRSVGNRWSEISSYLLGRNDNTIKNKWNIDLVVRAQEHYEQLDK